MDFSRNPEVVDNILEAEGPAYRTLDREEREWYNRKLFMLSYVLVDSEGSSREYMEKLREMDEFSPGELKLWMEEYGSIADAVNYGRKNTDPGAENYDLALRDEILDNIEVEEPEHEVQVEQYHNEGRVVLVGEEADSNWMSAEEDILQDPPR